MDDLGRLDDMKLFLAAAWYHRHAVVADGVMPPVPLDTRAFGRAIDGEMAKGNRYAGRFQVLGGPGARTCADFRFGLELAERLGAAHFCTGGFMVDLMPRARASLAAHREYAEAEAVAGAYFEELERQ